MAEPKDKDVTTAEVVDEVTRAGVTDVAAVIQSLNTPGAAFYSTITGTDFKTRLTISAALTNSVPIDDHKGEVFNLDQFIIQPVDLANEKGEINTAPRVTLISDDGTAYHGTSVGLLSALRNILAVVGPRETWDGAIAIKVVEARGRNGYKYFTIEHV